MRCCRLRRLRICGRISPSPSDRVPSKNLYLTCNSLACYPETNMNETHDPKAKSWVTSANQPGCDFPLQNLPFGVFRRKNHEGGGVGIAIGDQIFDVGAWVRDQGMSSAEFALLTEPRLNRFLSAGPQVWGAARKALFMLLRDGAPLRELVARYLDSMSNVEMQMPVKIADYTDFY